MNAKGNPPAATARHRLGKLAAGLILAVLLLPAGCGRGDNPVIEGTPAPESPPSETDTSY